MPFHSVASWAEAIYLARTYCHFGAVSEVLEMRIYNDWPSQDIHAAIRSAQLQFDLEPFN